MKTLIVEDDSTARTILQRFLSNHGECDFAVNGDTLIDQPSLILTHDIDLIDVIDNDDDWWLIDDTTIDN